MKNTFITTTIALAALALVVPIAAFAQSANTGIMPPGLANRMDTAQAWNFIQGTAISGVNQLQGHNNEQIILIPTSSAGNNGQVMAGFITVSSSKPISVGVAHYMSNTTAIPAAYGQPAYMDLTPAPNSTLITGAFVASNTT